MTESQKRRRAELAEMLRAEAEDVAREKAERKAARVQS